MVNKVIKPNTCKESLSKKKGITIRKSSCSTKKANINLKVGISTNSEVAIDVSVKFRNNSKVSTWAEAHFKCPNPKCDLVVSRYRTLFDHFADKCRLSGYESFQWWCDSCEIPRYWLGGSDLVRHKQVYHQLDDSHWPSNGDFPSEFLSFRSVPEDFDPKELLEHNKLFFGNKEDSDLWEKEVTQSQWYRGDGTHTVLFERPDKGSESNRKLEFGGRTYGTKKRPSRSKKVVAMIKDMAAQECVKEMLDEVMGKVYSDASRVKPTKMVLCTIGNDEGWVTGYAAHLIGVQESAHRDELNAKDAEIERLQRMLSRMRGDHKKAIEDVYSECDDRVKEIGDLAVAQVGSVAESLVASQPFIMHQVISVFNTATGVAMAQRVEDTSTIRRLASEKFSKVMTRDISVIDISD